MVAQYICIYNSLAYVSGMDSLGCELIIDEKTGEVGILEETPAGGFDFVIRELGEEVVRARLGCLLLFVF